MKKTDSNPILPLLMIVVAIVAIVNGRGDRPSPEPGPDPVPVVDDDKLAAACVLSYARRLADGYASIEPPEDEAEFGRMLNDVHRSAHNASFLPIDQSFDRQDYDPKQAKRRLESLARGFREVAP